MSIRTSNLKGRVAIVTGGSRGIGRECCLTLARHGCHVVVVAKTSDPTPNLPGTIHTTAAEVKALGVDSLPVQCDIRSEEACKAAIDKAVAHFGRIDILINNASALWWQKIEDTPLKKYDLIHSINARGTFCMTKYCLPHMVKNKFGRVITMSPPIVSSGYGGKTAYNISKLGMTMVAMGVAEEYRGKGVTGHSLWPATVVESQAAKNFELGETRTWRKAQILADCVLGLVSEPDDYTGKMLIDDVYLRTRQGFQDKDLVQYRYDPNFEPPRLLAVGENKPLDLRRGDVKKLAADKAISAKL